MGRIPDNRVSQFWDKDRLISHLMGEHDRRSIVWDRVLVYPPGAVWHERPPEALYSGGPVVKVTDATRGAIGQALHGVKGGA